MPKQERLLSLEVPGSAPTFTLADRLRKAREFANVGQVQLAADLGIARSSITNYEQSLSMPRPPVLIAWAVRCGVSLQWLLSGRENDEASPEAPLAQSAELRTFNPESEVPLAKVLPFHAPQSPRGGGTRGRQRKRTTIRTVDRHLLAAATA